MDKRHTRSLSGGRDNTNGHNGEELTIASPAEFVQRFGGNRVIEKVHTRHAQSEMNKSFDVANLSPTQCVRTMIYLDLHFVHFQNYVSTVLCSVTLDSDSQQWHRCSEVHTLNTTMGIWSVWQWTCNQIYCHGHTRRPSGILINKNHVWLSGA